MNKDPTMNPDFRAAILNSHQRLVIVATCVALWLVTMRIWRMRAGGPEEKPVQQAPAPE